MTIDLLYWVIGAYLAGSIPFGLLLGFLTGKGDIRKVGSGNIGATNMMRAGGKKLAALTLVLDGLKGFIPILAYNILSVVQLHSAGCLDLKPSCDQNFLLQWNHKTDIMIALLFITTIVGHIFPVWLKFKGGKGVATFLGGLFALDSLAGATFIILWLAMFAIKRISALSALTALYFAPFYVYAITQSSTNMNAVALMSALIIYRHKDNIKRMMSGSELGFTQQKDTTSA